MADYISRQAALKAVCDVCGVVPKRDRELCPYKFTGCKEYAEIISLQPADVRSVVLCGDCRWFTDTGYPNPDPDMPELRMGHCFILGRDVQACWFCGTGEQKEDEDG